MERKAQMAEEKVVTVLHSTQKRQEDPLPPTPSSIPHILTVGHLWFIREWETAELKRELEEARLVWPRVKSQTSGEMSDAGGLNLSVCLSVCAVTHILSCTHSFPYPPSLQSFLYSLYKHFHIHFPVPMSLMLHTLFLLPLSLCSLSLSLSLPLSSLSLSLSLPLSSLSLSLPLSLSASLDILQSECSVEHPPFLSRGRLHPPRRDGTHAQ